MHKFALEKIDEITGKQVFEKLLIDDSCQFDEFIKEVSLNKRYNKEVGKLYAYMEHVANIKLLPNTKYKPLKPTKNSKVDEYEFKTKNLRVYCIKKAGGKLIILGGYKNHQPGDLRRLRSIIADLIKQDIIK